MIKIVIASLRIGFKIGSAIGCLVVENQMVDYDETSPLIALGRVNWPDLDIGDLGLDQTVPRSRIQTKGGWEEGRKKGRKNQGSRLDKGLTTSISALLLSSASLFPGAAASTVTNTAFIPKSFIIPNSFSVLGRLRST